MSHPCEPFPRNTLPPINVPDPRAQRLRTTPAHLHPSQYSAPLPPPTLLSHPPHHSHAHHHHHYSHGQPHPSSHHPVTSSPLLPTGPSPIHVHYRPGYHRSHPHPYVSPRFSYRPYPPPGGPPFLSQSYPGPSRTVDDGSGSPGPSTRARHMSPSTTMLHRRSSAYQSGAVGGTDSHQLGDTFITLSPESVRKPTRKRRRPPVSYSVLIAQAILTSKDRRLTLREVYQWVSENHPYLSNSSDNGWQNTIRHNLSLNKCFVKVARADNEVTFNSAKGKGGYWTVNPDLMDSAVREGLDRAMRVPLPQRTAAEAQKAHQQQQQQIQREQRETTPLSTSGGPLNPAPANFGATPPPLPRSFTQSPSRPLAINTGVGSPSDAYLAQASSSLSLSAGPSAKASPLPSYAMLVDGCPMASTLSVGSGQHRYQQNQLLPPVAALQPAALLDSDSSAYHTPIRPHSQPPANSTPLVSPISSPGAASYTGGSPTRGATATATANASRMSDAMTDYTMSPRFAPTAPVMDTTVPTTVPIGSALGLADTLARAPISGPRRHHRGEGGTPDSESSDVSVLKIRNLLN